MNPPFTVRQYLGAAITLTLGGIWIFYEIHGETPPATLGQGLVVGLALLAGHRSGDRPGRGDAG